MLQNHSRAGTIYNQRLRTRSLRKASGDLNNCSYVFEDNPLNFHNATFQNANVYNYIITSNSTNYSNFKKIWIKTIKQYEF